MHLSVNHLNLEIKTHLTQMIRLHARDIQGSEGLWRLSLIFSTRVRQKQRSSEGKTLS